MTRFHTNRRQATLSAETVTVLCPYCGDVQPAKNGSEFWTKEDVASAAANRICNACDENFLLIPVRKVLFEP